MVEPCANGFAWHSGSRTQAMSPSLLINCYLQIKFYKIIRLNPPPPPPPNTLPSFLNFHYLESKIFIVSFTISQFKDYMELIII